MPFVKIGDMLLEKEENKVTFYFLDLKNKTFTVKEISGEDVKKLAALLWSGMTG